MTADLSFGLTDEGVLVMSHFMHGNRFVDDRYFGSQHVHMTDCKRIKPGNPQPVEAVPRVPFRRN